MNLPNKISLIRILLIPVMLFFYLATFISIGKLIAVIIFIIAACTDFLDGAIARKRNLVTNLGKFLDASADKMLVMAALLCITVDLSIIHPLGLLITFIIFARDLFISLLRQIASTKGVVIAADKWGKLKTIFLDIAIPCFMIIGANNINHFLNGAGLTIFQVFSYVLLGIGVFLTLLSCINYLVKNYKVFKENA